MPSIAWPYILLLLLSATLTAVLAILSWQRRPAPGAMATAVVLWALCEWCLTYALALSTPEPAWAGIWSRLRFIGISIIPVAWLDMALRYAGWREPMSVRWLAALLVVPAITLVLTWDMNSGLMFGAPVAEAPPPFQGVVLNYGPWYWIHTAYSYLLLLVGMVVLLGWLTRTRQVYTGQVALIASAAIVPWSGNVVTQLGIGPNPYLDLTPFCFVLSAIAVFIAMFRYQFLSLVPVARDAVLEEMNEGIMVVDEHQRIVDLNPAAQRVLQTTAQKALGQYAGEILPAWKNIISRLPYLPQVQEELQVRLEGVERTFDVVITRLGADRGKLNGHLVVLHDITAVKHAQQALEQNEQRYQTLFQTSNDGILVVALDGRILDCNHSACELYGYSREELLGLMARDLAPPGEITSLVRETRDVRYDSTTVTARGQRKEGTVFPAEVRTRVVQMANEPCVVAFVRDVTDRAQAEERWRWNDTVLRSMAENTPQAFCVVDDRNDQVLYANQRLGDLWGLDTLVQRMEQGEVATGSEVGATLQQHMTDPVEFAKTWGRLRGEIPRTVIEADLTLKDGRVYRWFSAQVRDSRGQYFGRLHVFENISDRRRAEDAQRMAAVGQLAAGVAHEFNNILCSMKLRADLARLRQEASDYGELINVVREGAEKGAQICDDMLSFARPPVPVREPINLETALEAAVSLAESRLNATHVQVKRSYQASGCLVSADKVQMEHVFLNLILNACDAMEQGGVLSLSTAFEELAGGQVVVEIEDTGTGIPPEHLPRIFEPFFTTKGRLGESDTPGTGLGLAVAHGLLQAHGATINVRSEWGNGAAFELRFPVHSVAESGVREQIPALGIPQGSRVLVADDEVHVRDSVAAAMQGQGYVVMTAATVPDALELLQSQEFEVVITDLLMPGGDGLAVVEAASRSSSKPPVLVVTGKASPGMGEQLQAAGAAHWLPKPFGLTELLVAVEIARTTAQCDSPRKN